MTRVNIHTVGAAAAIEGTALSSWMSIVSTATVAAIGLVSKLFLNSGYCSSVKVNGMHHLLNEIGRNEGRGVVTGVSCWFLMFLPSLRDGRSVQSPLNVRLSNHFPSQWHTNLTRRLD
jgi:hypothetical protein